MSTTIIKNTTLVTKNWGGRQYAASAQYTIEEIDRLRLLSDPVFITDLNAGNAVVNNGSADLTAAVGITRLTGIAGDQWFDNSTNGFSAKTTQSAVEEAKDIALGKSRFTIVCTFNGTVGNNNWLGFSEVLPGDQVPIRLPLKCRLKEIQFSYTQSSLLGIPLGSEQVDGRFDLYKNGLTSPANVVFQGTFTNNAGGKYFTNINVDLNAGDWIVGRWVDQGDNPSDLAIVYFFEVRE